MNAHRTRRCWLFKSEPGAFSITDLASCPQQTTFWNGVRNYQARNFLRDAIAVGDTVLFYHSNTEQPAIAGICDVVRGGYPDHSALDPENEYYDPKSTPDNPRWYMVDIRLREMLDPPLPLERLRAVHSLGGMQLLQRGNRLSILPVTDNEWQILATLSPQISRSITG